MRIRLPALLAAALAVASCHTAGPSTASSPAGGYDVVIANGKIMDGTGNAWFYGDVGIVGDRIARIAPAGVLASAPARTRIDATGLVIAPGFIDIQGQSNYQLLLGDGRLVSKITQGVTTEILGEGSTPAPMNDNTFAAEEIPDSLTHVRALYNSFRGPHGFGAWLDSMQAHGMSVNVGSYLGAASVRVYAMGQRAGAPTAAELDTMRAVVRRAMEDGAFGVASALIYPPGSYATTRELTEMAKAMSPYHGDYITHMRSEEDSLFEAMDEAFTIAREGGVTLDIYHLKAATRSNWYKARGMIAKIDSARASGLDVAATMYSYAASGNGLAACFPGWVSENGKLMDNLRDAATRARVVADMLRDKGCDPSEGAKAIMGFATEPLKKYEGWMLADIAKDMQLDIPNTVIALTLAENNRLGKINYSMSEENVALQLRRPWVVIGSDADGLDPDSAQGLTHPRAYGTFPRVLGKYARDDSLFTMEEAVRKMSGGTAARLKLRDRGLLREGFYADVVVFDPVAIRDVATFAKPHQLSVGVRDVFVNGTAVVRSGRVTGAKPGRVVRGVGYRR